MGAPKKIADKNIPNNTDADDDDDDLDITPNKDVDDDEDDFDVPLDDLGFEELGDDVDEDDDF